MELFLHYLSLDYLLQGVLLTLDVTVLGLAGGLLLGVVLAGMQMSRHRWLSGFARTYAVIFRGTPLILQMVFAYDALPHIGLKLSAVAAGGLALAANEAPFIAEMLRSGILGVDRGQIAAGQALGMSSLVLMRRIIAPQAIRTMIPAFGNESVSALKNSSLASIISVPELTLRSTQLASSTFDFFSIFFASGVIYLLLTSAIGGLQLLADYLLDLDRAPSQHPLLRWFSRIWTKNREGVSAGPAQGAGNATSECLALEKPPSTSAVATTISHEDRAARSAELGQGKIMVQVQNLSKRFGKHPVFNGLDLTVRTGEVVALLGPSGSGKSTLLRCINRLEEWDDGVVRICGRRVGYAEGGVLLTPTEVAKQRAVLGVGMVFQQFNLFSHLTALENVSGPLRWVHGMSEAQANQRAHELLERVGLSHRAHALPRHLSGGQQQRVAISRALAPRPSLLLLDEPTSALDPELVNEVLEVIRKLANEDGLTMIISTHQVRFAKEIADRVVFLSNGIVTEEGPANDVLTSPKHPLTARFLSVMGADYAAAVPA
jgi:polar amino acid transport system ATP-binding protein/polar amino acid transport system permease protein